MTHTYGQLFDMLPSEEPSQQLFDKILIRIERAELSRLGRRALAYRSLGYAALAGCIAGCAYLAEVIVQSDIPTYLSLIMTDGSYVLSSWREFALSISDSFPVPETIGVLLFVVACAQFLRVSAKYRDAASERSAHHLASLV